MSVIEGKNPTSLRMKFDLGKDELTNKTKVKSKTYSNLNMMLITKMYMM